MFRLTQLVPSLLLALSACRAPTDATSQLLVTLSVDRTVATPSTPVGITVSVLNRGPEHVQIVNPLSYACFAPYSVIDHRGDALPLPGRFCNLPGYPPFTLSPGETVDLRDAWAATMAGGSGEPVPAPAGQYRIVARIHAAGRDVSSAAVVVTVPATGPSAPPVRP